MYEHLGKHDGIFVDSLDLSGDGIKMASMVHGNLEDCLTKRPFTNRLVKLVSRHGSIIEACWKKGAFHNAYNLLAALDAAIEN